RAQRGTRGRTPAGVLLSAPPSRRHRARRRDRGEVMRRSILLSIVLVAGCASGAGTPSSTTVDGAARSSSPADTEPGEQVAKSSAWLIDMDRGALESGPGELEAAASASREPSR